jgi:hypothetical protein
MAAMRVRSSTMSDSTSSASRRSGEKWCLNMFLQGMRVSQGARSTGIALHKV